MMNAVNGDKDAQRMDREIFQQLILASGASGDWAGGEVVRRANGLWEPVQRKRRYARYAPVG